MRLQGLKGFVFLGLSSCQEMPVTTLNVTFPVRDLALMIGVQLTKKGITPPPCQLVCIEHWAEEEIGKVELCSEFLSFQ